MVGGVQGFGLELRPGEGGGGHFDLLGTGIDQLKSWKGVCRTAFSAERSDADAQRRRSSAKSRKTPGQPAAHADRTDVTKGVSAMRQHGERDRS